MINLHDITFMAFGTDTFIQSDLQRVHLLKEQYISVVHKDKNRAGLQHS